MEKIIVVQQGDAEYIPTNRGLKFVGYEYGVLNTIEFLKSKGFRILTMEDINAIKQCVNRRNKEIDRINKEAFQDWQEDMEYKKLQGYSVIGNFFEDPEERYFILVYEDASMDIAKVY